MMTVYRLLETFKVTKCPETPNLEDGGNDSKHQLTIWLFFSLSKLSNFKMTLWPDMFQMVTIYKLLEILKFSKGLKQQMWKWPKIPNDHVTLLFTKSTNLEWPNDLKNQMTWHVSNGDNIKTVGNFEVIKRPETTNVKMTQNTKWPCDLIIFKINNFKVTNHVTQHESCGDR